MFFLISILLVSCIFFVLNLPVHYKIVVEEVDLKIPVVEYGVSRPLNSKELNCLADNIFFEAGNQSDLGKKAVAYVTLNRLYSTQYPDDICKIVYARKGGVCQFSWVCKPQKLRARKNKEFDMWLRSMSIANIVVNDYNIKDDPTRGALHFHADYVTPYWAKVFNRTVVIDNHIFYRPRYGT